MTMTSSRPYLIRALYDWIVENDCTPYILVNAGVDGVDVPREHIRDGRITLNISASAVHDLVIHNETVDFDGRFAGVSRRVIVPVAAVAGIYARENGQGMIFDSDSVIPEPPNPTGSGDPGATTPSSERRKPAAGKAPLKLVK